MVVWQAAGLLRETGDPTLVLKSVLFGEGYEQQVLGVAGFEIKQWVANMALVSVSFVNPCWFFAARGLISRGGAVQMKVRGVLWGLTALYVLFWFRFFVPDQATFVLPTLGLLAIWVSLGAGEVLKFESSRVLKFGSANAREFGSTHVQELRGARARLYAGVLAAGVVCAVAEPWLLSVVVERAGWKVERIRTLPFRNEMRYWVLPWKQHEVSAARFVEEVEKSLRAGDVLIADSTAAGPLLAAREAGVLSKGWRLVSPWSGESEEELRSLAKDVKLRVFVVSPVAGYAPKAVLEQAAGFEPEGVVYRMKLRSSTEVHQRL
jgi:hypothetical protein